MKIGIEANPGLLNEVAGKEKAKGLNRAALNKKKESAVAKSSYSVNLSPNVDSSAISKAKATAIAKATEPTRENRIQELKQRIQSGTYQVDSGKVADGILKEAIKDEVAKNPNALLV